MEVKQHFKCKLWRTDLERFRLICKFLDIPMSVMCGALIENFNEKMRDRLQSSDCVNKALCLEVHEEFELIRKQFSDKQRPINKSDVLASYDVQEI